MPTISLIDHPSELESLLQATIGVRTRLADYTVINRRQDYCVLRAHLQHPKMDVVIKLAGPDAKMASQFDRTAAIHQLVAASTAIPQPEIIASDITFNLWPWRYLILAAIPGVEWAVLRNHLNDDELAGVYRQLGEAVGQLHQISFPGFGEIDNKGHVEQPDLDCLNALKARVVKLNCHDWHKEIILDVLEQRSSWFQSVKESRLSHEDLHGHNILFARESGEWRLAAIIDFDKAWAGHSEIDLSRLEIWRGMTSPYFWTAYQAWQSLDEGYVRRRPVYQLWWCVEYASPTPQHTIDTRRVCQELGLLVTPEF